MRDEFLYEAAPAMREGFGEALYEKLSRRRRSSSQVPSWLGFNRKTTIYALSAVLVAVIAVACARELFKQRYVQVGDIWVLEVAPQTIQRIDFFDRPVNALSLPPTPIPVAEAIESLPYEFRLPEWVPQGYSLVEQEVTPPIAPDWIINLNWAKERGEVIFLWIHKGGAEIRVPPDMWKETRVNGATAVLIRGRFPFPFFPDPTPGATGPVEREVQWNEGAGLTLVWKQGEFHFELMTFGDYVTEEDLIRMAESMGGP